MSDQIVGLRECWLSNLSDILGGICRTWEFDRWYTWSVLYDDTDSTYEELLTKSKLPTLKIRRIRTIAIETFKIVNKTSPLYLHDLITIKQSKYSFRYHNTASTPSTRTTRYGIKTFKYFAAKTWNELPNHFRLANSFKQFKNLINSWNGSSCHCNACR